MRPRLKPVGVSILTVLALTPQAPRSHEIDGAGSYDFAAPASGRDPGNLSLSFVVLGTGDGSFVFSPEFFRLMSTFTVINVHTVRVCGH